MGQDSEEWNKFSRVYIQQVDILIHGDFGTGKSGKSNLILRDQCPFSFFFRIPTLTHYDHKLTYTSAVDGEKKR